MALLGLLLLVTAPEAAQAQQPATTSEAAATPEKVRALLSLMDDPEVRQWLGEHQKEAPAARASAAPTSAMMDMTAPVMVIRHHILASLAALPTALPELARATQALAGRNRGAGPVGDPAARSRCSWRWVTLRRAALLAGNHRLPPPADRAAPGHGAGATARRGASAGLRPGLDGLLRRRLARRLSSVRLAAAAARPDRPRVAARGRGVAHHHPAAVRNRTRRRAVSHPADEHGIGAALVLLAHDRRGLVRWRPCPAPVSDRSWPVRAGGDTCSRTSFRSSGWVSCCWRYGDGPRCVRRRSRAPSGGRQRGCAMRF